MSSLQKSVNDTLLINRLFTVDWQEKKGNPTHQISPGFSPQTSPQNYNNVIGFL